MENLSIDINEMSERCKTLIISVGKFIIKSQDLLKTKDVEVKDKSLNNLVTRIDQEAEQKLVAGLKEILPDSGFITEEQTVQQHEKKKFIWIIDPLDGTTNFIHGLSIYSISVALTYHSRVIMGMVYDICNENYYHAVLDKGAYRNGQSIAVSDRIELSSSLIGTGFPYDDFTYLNEYMLLLSDIMSSSRGVRRLGSAALDLCYVAEGILDVFFEYNLQIWDVAAGVLIVSEAGGVVTDFRGSSDYFERKEIIASNPSVYSEFKAMLDKRLSIEI